MRKFQKFHGFPWRIELVPALCATGVLAMSVLVCGCARDDAMSGDSLAADGCGQGVDAPAQSRPDGPRVSPMELFQACVKEVQAILEMDDTEVARALVRGILVGDAWLERFLATETDDDLWKAESMHLEMQQYVAIRVASQPERFARILMEYYHSGRDAGVGADSGDDLRSMALKLVRQGALFEKLLDDETADEPMIARCRYSADEPVRDEADPDKMTVRAEFLKFRMDRAYEIEFRQLPLDADHDVKVWLPVAKKQLQQ